MVNIPELKQKTLKLIHYKTVRWGEKKNTFAVHKKHLETIVFRNILKNPDKTPTTVTTTVCESGGFNLRSERNHNNNLAELKAAFRFYNRC